MDVLWDCAKCSALIQVETCRWLSYSGFSSSPTGWIECVGWRRPASFPSCFCKGIADLSSALGNGFYRDSSFMQPLSRFDLLVIFVQTAVRKQRGWREDASEECWLFIRTLAEQWATRANGSLQVRGASAHRCLCYLVVMQSCMHTSLHVCLVLLALTACSCPADIYCLPLEFPARCCLPRDRQLRGCWQDLKWDLSASQIKPTQIDTDTHQSGTVLPSPCI